MDNFVDRQDTYPPAGETPAEREARLVWQRAAIAQAEAEIAAGLIIDGEALDAWLDELDRDENAPMPLPMSTGRRS